MDGPREDHTQRIKSDRDKYHMTSLICGILKKKKKIQRNLLAKQKQAHRFQKQNLWLPKGKDQGKE